MRLALVAAAVLALLTAPAASSTQAAAPKTIGTRGAVASIAADGARVAIHAVVYGDPDCDAGSVWTPTSGAVVRFQDAPCGPKQSDKQYEELTLAGSRVAWVDYDFGNHAYCQGPFTATLTKPKPADLGRCPFPDEGGDVYWEFQGDGNLLVGRDYLLCEANCEPDYDRTYQTDVTIWAIRASARKLFGVKDDTQLLAVSAGRILLLESGGTLVVYSGAGKRGLAVKAGAKSGGLSGNDLVGLSGRTLKVYDAASGSLKFTRTLAAAAKLHDVDQGFAVYAAAGAVHLLRLAGGRDTVIAKGSKIVDADLEASGLNYGHNSGTGSKPGRVTFMPSSGLPK